MERYVYIKQNIAKHYIDFAEPLNQEEYSNIGEGWQDYLDNKWVLLNDSQVLFLSQNPNASPEEVWNMRLNEPEVVEEPVVAPEPPSSYTLKDLSENLSSEEKASIITNLGLVDNKSIEGEGEEHELLPNVHYDFGETESLVLTFGTPKEGVTNVYGFSFDSPSECATQLVLPDDIIWPCAPSVSEGHHYEVSVVYNSKSKVYYGKINEW